GKVADARAAKVGMGKPTDHAILIVISRTPVPAFIKIVGSQLNATKRYIGTYKYMSMSAGTDKGIHVGGELLPDGEKRNYAEQQRDDYLHKFAVILFTFFLSNTFQATIQG